MATTKLAFAVIALLCVVPCSHSLIVTISPATVEAATSQSISFTCTYFPPPNSQLISRVEVKWYKYFGLDATESELVWTAINNRDVPGSMVNSGDGDLEGDEPSFEGITKSHKLTFSSLQSTDTTYVNCYVNVTWADGNTDEGTSVNARLVVDGKVCDLAPTPCENGGSCNVSVQQCDCPAGYNGTFCETVLYCYAHNCENGGTCVELDSGHHCQCHNGTTGEHCERVIKCFSNPCQNGGTCIEGRRNRNFTCNCAPGFGGTTCNTVASCDSSPCVLEPCVEKENGYSCPCVSELAEDGCGTNLTCEQEPCKNNGICSNSTADAMYKYSCECIAGYVGRRCDTGDIAVSISGYTNPLNEGDDMELTCQLTGGLPSEVDFAWSLSQLGRNSMSISAGQAYHKSSVGEADIGLYTCKASTKWQNVTAGVNVIIQLSEQDADEGLDGDSDDGEEGESGFISNFGSKSLFLACAGGLIILVSFIMLAVVTAMRKRKQKKKLERDREELVPIPT